MPNLFRLLILLAVSNILGSTQVICQEHRDDEMIDRLEQRIQALREQRRAIIEQVEQLRGEQADPRRGNVHQEDIDRVARIHELEHRVVRARFPELAMLGHDQEHGGHEGGSHHHAGEHHEGGGHHPAQERFSGHDPHRQRRVEDREMAAARGRLEHMHRAHEHAMAAGMGEIAEQIASRMRRLERRLVQASREVDRRERGAAADGGKGNRPGSAGRRDIDQQFRREILGGMRRLNAGIDQLRAEISELREEVEELEEEIE